MRGTTGSQPRRRSRPSERRARSRRPRVGDRVVVVVVDDRDDVEEMHVFRGRRCECSVATAVAERTSGHRGPALSDRTTTAFRARNSPHAIFISDDVSEPFLASPSKTERRLKLIRHLIRHLVSGMSQRGDMTLRFGDDEIPNGEATSVPNGEADTTTGRGRRPRWSTF